MNSLYCANACVFQIVVIVFCLTIDNAIGQQSKISIWPPKEQEFLDADNDNIRGIGGIDYPIHSFIPKTAFTCNGQLPGFYADEEADCQVFHLCNNNHKISFMCGNGTIFNQKLFTCNWWYNTTCSDSHKFYSMNAELYKVKAKSNETKQLPKIDIKNVNIENKKFPPQKITRLPQTTNQIQNRIPQEVIRQNVGQQVPQMANQIQNRIPQEVIRQNIGQQLPQMANQIQNKFPQEVLRQNVGQQFPHKQQMIDNNEPIVRHLELAEPKESISEESEPQEYELAEEKDENLEELSV